MKLVIVFGLVVFSLCTYSATALFGKNLPLGDGLSLGSILPSLDPLRNLLRTLGISVEHLVEGLKKCVDELGPEASTSVKKLLEALSFLV
ncbi:secretoglobin family 3A member 2 [Suncus etruscus]|uniref:secretoglobin family 3A member 2 n=1 Tax=Suncus etruscus TaxID=109475 RepID=UPI0021109841|nr:secretoglobin family 3A member 2 [Suncus etruscus]